MPKRHPLGDLDKFVVDLARNLMTLRDEDSGDDVGLTPFEVQYVGKELAKYGNHLVDRMLRQMTRKRKP